MLHTDCRVTEKLLHQLTVAISKAMAETIGHPKRSVVEKVKQDFLNILNKEVKINGGKCDIVMVTKNGGEKVGKISLNGADARKLKLYYQRLLQTVEPLTQVFTDDHYKELLLTRHAMWAQWNHCDKWFHKHTMEAADYVQAIVDFQEFVRSYRACPPQEGTAASITHYIHVLEAHTSWFLGQGSPMSPALVSTQAMEHMHKWRNKWLRSCTMHGKPIVLTTSKGPEILSEAPEVWQYLQKYHRIFRWREMVSRQPPALKWHTVSITELACLDTSSLAQILASRLPHF